MLSLARKALVHVSMSGGRLAGSEASKTDRGLGALPPELVLGIAVYLPAQAYLALACTSSRMHRFLLADAFAADKAAARTGLAACIHHARWRAAAMALAVTRPDDRNMLWAQVPSPLAGLFDLDPPPLGDSEWLALVEALARVGALTHTGDGVPCWPMAASAVLSGLPDVAKAVFHVSDGVGRAAMVRAVAMVANEALVEWLLLHDDGELALGIDQGVLLRRCAMLGKNRAVAGLLACGRVDPAAKDSAAVSHAAIDAARGVGLAHRLILFGQQPCVVHPFADQQRGGGAGDADRRLRIACIDRGGEFALRLGQGQGLQQIGGGRPVGIGACRILDPVAGPGKILAGDQLVDAVDQPGGHVAVEVGQIVRRGPFRKLHLKAAQFRPDRLFVVLVDVETQRLKVAFIGILRHGPGGQQRKHKKGGAEQAEQGHSGRHLGSACICARRANRCSVAG